MRRLLLPISLLVVALPVLAADETQILLEAPRVKRTIQLELTADKKDVLYAIDNDTSETLKNGTNFAGVRGVDLTYKNFNPFDLSVTSTETTSPDPVNKAVGDFLDALMAFAKGFGNKGGAASVGSAFVTTGCATTDTALKDAAAQSNRVSNPSVSVSDLTDWKSKAIGRPGVLIVRDLVQTKLDNVKLAITNIQTVQKKLAETPECATNANAVQQAVAITTALANAESAEQRLKKSLEEILAMLNAYLARTWRQGSAVDSDLLIREVDSDPATEKVVVITFEAQKYTPKDDTIELTTDSKFDRTLVVRRYRRYVPEVGVAAVYNDLKYPKYSIKDGKIARNDDSGNVDAAMTMNLLCNCIGGGFLYPGAQLGISKAKDYPGILAGVVLRFAQPKQFSIAVGRMVTWYKDLSSLKVGDETTADKLQADLKQRRSPTAWYLAAQFTF